METYAEMYKQAEKNKNVKELSALYKKWKKEGDFIIGRYIDVTEVTSSLNNKTYNQYLFDTDEGVIKFHLGKGGDSEIGAQLVKGVIYRIMFTGKVDLQGGRTVNTYDCIMIMDHSVDVETGEIKE